MKVTLDPTVLVETVPGDARLFVLRKDFHFTIDGEPGYSELGEVTDFASIPFDWAVAEPWILRAAIVHDLYCRYRGKPPHGPVLSGLQTAWMFPAAMRACNAPFLKRVAGFIGVSAWAIAHWNDFSNTVWRRDLKTKIKLAKALHAIMSGKTPPSS